MVLLMPPAEAQNNIMQMDFYFDVLRCAVVAAFFVSLRVIISKQFGSSTLLHGFESSPHMVASTSRVHSCWTVDWERAREYNKSKETQKWRFPWLQSALLSAHILFMCKWKTQHHRIKSKCQFVNDSSSFFLSASNDEHICCKCRSLMHCILIVLCARKREREKDTIFSFFLLFSCSHRTRRPHRRVCVSAEWHLIYRLSVRKQVHTRPHSTAWHGESICPRISHAIYHFPHSRCVISLQFTVATAGSDGSFVRSVQFSTRSQMSNPLRNSPHRLSHRTHPYTSGNAHVRIVGGDSSGEACKLQTLNVLMCIWALS